MQTETAVKALTETDLKALKQANVLVYRHMDGKGTIECIKKVKVKNKINNSYDEIEQRHHIDVNSVIYSSRKDRVERTSAFGSNHFAKEDLQVQTMIYFLKKGDEVTLRFYADHGSNQLTEERDLHVDHFVIRINRSGKRFEFLVDVQVTLDNSARMIGYK